MKFESLARQLNWVTIVCLVILAFSSNPGWAKGEITQIQTELRAATPSSYTRDGVHYQWGTGHDLVINGFVYQGETYDYQQIADRVEVRRVDNPQSSGQRCSVFAETVGSSLSYAASYPATTNALGNCDMGQLIGGNVLNAGALDVFSNDGVRPGSIKNIERVDFIRNNGLLAKPTAAELELSGQVVIEKSANNPLQIAAITSLDADGSPASYGSLVSIHPADEDDAGKLRYGLTDIELELDFLSTDNSENPGRLAYWGSRWEKLGMVFISQADLGLEAGQRYFGFSLFPSDVDAAVHTLTDPTTFPGDSRDTSNLDPGDADFFAAFALQGGMPIENQPPVAEDDFLFIEIGEAGTIDLLENDFDPEGDQLVATLIDQPVMGVISLDNGVASYTPNPGASGSEELIYSIDDGNGGTDMAILTISIPAVLTGSSGRIATGLEGHGAGSMDLWFLTIIGSLLVVGKRRKRQGS